MSAAYEMLIANLDAVLRTNEPISPDDIAIRLLDEPFHDIALALSDLITEMSANDDSREPDEVEQLRIIADALVVGALGNAEQDLWEAFDELLSQEPLPDPQAAAVPVRSAMTSLRAAVIRALADMPPPTPTYDEDDAAANRPTNRRRK